MDIGRIAHPRLLALLLPSMLLIGGPALSAGSGPAIAIPKPSVDLSSTVKATAMSLANIDRLGSDPVLARMGTIQHLDERLGVPRFFLAARGPETRVPPGTTPEQAARVYLTKLAPYYRLTSADVRSAPLRYVNAKGKGGVIVAFRQEVEGIPVFREEMKVLLDRNGGLLAVSGSIPGRAEVRSPAAFRIGVVDAIAAALADMTDGAVGKGGIQRLGAAEGGYETYTVHDAPAAKLTPDPIRARRVLFRLGEQLVPAYHIELSADGEAPTYVIAGDDARVLLRNDRIAYDAYSYRVWADAAGSAFPHDGPAGTSATPHPTGTPSNYYPPFIAPSLVALQNGPISTNDPWLPPGATTTSGNNVDAYADLVAPDGFSAGDLRATTTSPGVFDRTFDLNQAPGANANQQMASITNLFYVNNFLHDWYYDAGFDEAAGNAQLSNLGRGGVEGDPIKAEAQDYSGTNNANMSTPADGGSPRMQMYVWDPNPYVRSNVNNPASIAGAKPGAVGTANPTSYNVTGDFALPFPGTFSSTASTLTTGSSPHQVQIADLNGDGHPDLAVPNANSNSVSVFLSDGAGGFLAPVSYATGASGPQWVVTPDLNQDGLPDLVTANQAGSLSVRLNTGGGAFGANTLITTASGSNSMAVGRFDADTIDDVVVTNASSNSVNVLLGNGTGGFQPKTTLSMSFSPYSVAVGDLNHDGFADLVVANLGEPFVCVRLGTGLGTFGALTIDSIANSPRSVALADLNGDGKLDAITANNGNNTVSVAFGNGLGGFGAATMYAVPASPVSMIAKDFNGDGIVDVIVACNPAGSVSLLANNGAGVLGTPQTIAVGTNPLGVSLGDVTGDHQPDILAANSGSASVTVLAGTVTPSASTLPPFANVLTGRVAILGAYGGNTNAQLAEAQAKGAVAAVLPGYSPIFGTFGTSVALPSFMLYDADVTGILSALKIGPVNFTLAWLPSLRRDSALDNLIVAHEWGHYLSNRLIGDGSGLASNQSKGMGEGWSDFCALLLEVRPEDALVASNPNWSGTFTASGHAMASTAVTDNFYYYGVRRYPYSTDFAKNPLTFKHIQDGVPLPAGPPAQATSSYNSEVHNTGEVWCAALWECYASLLRDTGRLTFAQARDRMRSYLVQSLEMTPITPTFLDARDALLAVASATDPADQQDFLAAFARRGMGTGAVAPSPSSSNNSGVVESFVVGGDLQVVSIAVDDSVRSCDQDGILDAGEDGRVRVMLRNLSSSVSLSSTTATISSSDPSLQFPSGHTIAVPASQPNQTVSVWIPVRGGGSGVQIQQIQVAVDDPALIAPHPRTASVSSYLNVDEAPSNIETFNESNPTWTTAGPFLAQGTKLWNRVQSSAGSVNRLYLGTDPGSVGDESLVSPPLVVGTDDFSFNFQHAYSFEGGGGSYYDGGVVEISTDGGANWTDIGAMFLAGTGYTGTLSAAYGNPLGGRPAFSGISPHYPDRDPAVVDLGTAYAGQTVKIRFRIGADSGGGAAGWTIDDIVVNGITNAPFLQFVADPGPCSPVAVDPPSLPTELSFAIAGANPSRGVPAFRFSLPKAARVTIAVYDLSGRRVATLTDGAFDAGVHNASWTSEAGRRKPGVYFARMVTDGAVLDRRVVVLTE